MADPFIGEIRLFSCNFAPDGWAICNGQMLQVKQNNALFSILGNRYGGDGKETFALPNLQGRAALHPGPGMKVGDTGGEEAHALTVTEIPPHTHPLTGGSDATTFNPVTNTPGTTGKNPYAVDAKETIHPNAIGTAGGSAAHPNMQPYTVLNYCIAVTGIYPMHN